MSGTGRRRKPPTGEEGEGQQQSQPGSGQPPYASQDRYQTYQQPGEPQYDYDWRRQQPAQQPAFDPFRAAPAAPAAPPPPAPPQQAPQPPVSQPPVSQPFMPQQPQRGQYDGYDQYGGYDRQQAAAYPPPDAPQAAAPQAPPSIPAQPRWEEPAAPAAAAPAPPRASVPPQAAPPRSAPPGASADFDFDLDLDDPEPPASAPPGAPPAAPPTGAANRPADKDGYRPGDFAFVDEGDDPDVGGWLEFSESRADTRAERARKLRVRLIAGGALAALVAVGVGLYAWLGGSTPAAQATATRSMILFRLDDTKGDSVGDALMVTELNGSTTGTATGTGALVVIPSQMQIDDEGFGNQPFGGDMAQDQPPAGVSEVSDALGVTPDGVWTVDETTFGIFVDEIGGISLTTNTAVPPSALDPKGVPAGPTKLSGVQAVAYATYQAPGEPATAQAVRFGQVLNALLAALPSYSNSVTAYLNQLGLIPDPSLPLSKLSPILAALAAQQSEGKVSVATLPLAANGSDALNTTGASEIVSKYLGGTLKAGASAGQSARVLVQDGTGASGGTDGKLLAEAQAQLVDAGYTYNAGNSVAVQAHTEVEVASSADQSLGAQVAAALGLSGSTVRVVPGVSTLDDVTVVLGQDWSSFAGQ
jgi:anionic cell wall polymer biosynthesis LytR-Cps2A-Psr (LCP) family protein